MGLDDKVEAEVDQAKGKAKQEIGEKTGDRSTEMEGHMDEAKGDAKEKWEDTKDAVGDKVKDIVD
ncbi:MAG TPA: CsbD family protein [Actinomycetota bacterium]|nr:CsbD family protein [Actinomycetota bacterium]